ncbi:hypothetical protein N7532_006417 [Penicillium argentinense]|uniref:Nitrogen regulatory protein areA GATA-like domain-containing protein n=1 Tax=Penicillium argentinense TaxID=1131581 RepID=A0A9W9FFX7_9EURO|nr:uncharacterized protein N7532_006417 [Penicillium argentinense]KAJ5099416.1 hypothetical protein N7532_006417 [Penicillium argentinense]
MEQKDAPSLVRISQAVPEMRRDQPVDLQMVQDLWRAFYVTEQATRDQAHRRLGYLFWRVWSSEKLLTSISVGQLSDLIARIAAPMGYFRRRGDNSQTSTSPYHFKGSPQSVRKSQPIEAKATPQPILKKSSTPQAESNKSARLLVEKPDGESIARSPSNALTLDLPKSHPQKLAARQGPKKAAHFAAGFRSGRRRPLFQRRKSSQTSVPKEESAAPKQQKPEPQQPRPQPQPQPQHPPHPYGDSLSFDLVFGEDSALPLEESPHNTPLYDKMDSPDIDEMLDQLSTLKLPKTTPSEKATATATAVPAPDLDSDAETLISPAPETVSEDPQDETPKPKDKGKGKQRAEPNDSGYASSSSSSDGVPADWTRIPGFENIPSFKNRYRIPMPEKMKEALTKVLNDPEPIEKVPLPTRPWWQFEDAWGSLPRKEYLEDWMLTDYDHNGQPSNFPLVEPGFRTRFAEQVQQRPQPPAEPAISRSTSNASNASAITVVPYRERGNDQASEHRGHTRNFSGLSFMMDNTTPSEFSLEESEETLADRIRLEQAEAQNAHENLRDLTLSYGDIDIDTGPQLPPNSVPSDRESFLNDRSPK